MRTLCWMCGHIMRDRIKNKDISKKVRVTPVMVQGEGRNCDELDM